MAEPACSTRRVAEGRTFDMRSLWRLAIWGASATLALTVAVFAAYSNVGTQRLMTAMASGSAGGQRPAASPAAQVAARTPEVDVETRRLSDAVRALTADRDRLVARIGVLERSVQDMTGSIRRQNSSNANNPPAASEPRQTAAVPVVPPTVTPVVPAPPAPTAQSESTPLARPATVVANAKPAENPADAAAAKPELGIDVGGAVNFAGLRALWTSLRTTNAAQLEGLTPAVVVRENARTRATELRLILGPVKDAEAAGRLCAPLTAARRYCQSAPFEGQHLSIADLYQERRAAPAPRAPTAAAQPQATQRPSTPASQARPARPNP